MSLRSVRSVRLVLFSAAMLLLLACGDDAAYEPSASAAGGGAQGSHNDSEATATPDDGDRSTDTEGSAPSASADGSDPEPTSGSGDNSGSVAPARSPADRLVDGTVVAANGGVPLAGASVSFGSAKTITGPDGHFSLVAGPDDDVVEVARSGWQSAAVDLDRTGDGAPDQGPGPPLTVELEPFVARGLRVSRTVAANGERFDGLLALAEGSTVNALVFDTKDETGSVLYATNVEFANRIGAVDVVYDPTELLALAAEHDLYTITRIVTFEDRLWSAADPQAKLAGEWVNAGDERNWRYPIDLAVEACGLGFREIQFDYVRYPAGRTATAAADRMPPSGQARSEVIAGFLDRAASELNPLGCGVSAAVFGIVMSSPTDEGIGQLLETVSPAVDVVSPMLYPSHYSPGWLGFPDPNDQPGPVVADALEGGSGRLPPPALLRPWLQAFGYNGDQVRAQIDEAEKRGAGWMLWNAGGNYRPEWLPPS